MSSKQEDEAAYKFRMPEQKKPPQQLSQLGQRKNSITSVRSQASSINYHVYDGNGVKPFSKQDIDKKNKVLPDQVDNDSAEFKSHDLIPKLKANLKTMIKKTQKFFRQMEQIDKYVEGIDESFEAIDYNYKTLKDYLFHVLESLKPKLGIM